MLVDALNTFALTIDTCQLGDRCDWGFGRTGLLAVSGTVMPRCGSLLVLFFVKSL